MPLYEGRHNVENIIKVSDEARESIICGPAKTINAISDLINSAQGAVALDGWYGVDFEAIIKELKAACPS